VADAPARAREQHDAPAIVDGEGQSRKPRWRVGIATRSQVVPVSLNGLGAVRSEIQSVLRRGK